MCFKALSSYFRLYAPAPLRQRQQQSEPRPSPSLEPVYRRFRFASSWPSLARLLVAHKTASHNINSSSVICSRVQPASCLAFPLRTSSANSWLSFPRAHSRLRCFFMAKVFFFFLNLTDQLQHQRFNNTGRHAHCAGSANSPTLNNGRLFSSLLYSLATAKQNQLRHLSGLLLCF